MSNTEIDTVTVCVFCPDAYPYFNSQSHSKLGGAELQLYTMAVELARDDSFLVHVVVDADRGVETRKNVTVHKTQLGSRKAPLELYKGLYRVFRFFQTINADIYIQRAASYWTFVLSTLSRLFGKKFVYMAAHDGDANKELHPRRNGVIRRCMWWLYEYGLRHADLIIAQNTYQQEHFRKNYGRESIIRLSAHRIPAKPNRQQKKTVLWVGRAKPWKQPRLFLDLARSYPDEQFCMVMSSFGEHLEAMEQIKNDAREIDNLTFYEYIPPDKIDEVFVTAKLYVLTSTSEGFPNTFIQAAKTATPILSYAVDPNGMLETHDIGRNAYSNTNTFQKHFEELIESNSYWLQLSDNAYEYALTHHNIERVIENDKIYLRSLLKG